LNEKINEGCGLFGIWRAPQAASITYLGLYSLQHRGQESAGIVSFDGRDFFEHRGMGLVSEVFSPQVLRRLKGRSAIGHNRYSTSGESTLTNAQPLLVNLRGGRFSIAHNGNLVNSSELTKELEAKGSIFRSTLDSEVIVHLVARSQKEDTLQMIIEALRRVRGGYSLLILTQDGLIAVRDPRGIRPLCMGSLNGATTFASESCAFDLIGADYQRELDPGELIWVGKEGVESLRPFPSVPSAACIFESACSGETCPSRYCHLSS
jgi:amidophosphoribosyltransferase